jgi:hypothetical protein
MKLTRDIAPAVLWVLSFALAGAAMHAAATSVRTDSVPIATIDEAPAVPAVVSPELLQQHADSLRQRNPFRLERAPTSQPYGAPPAVDVPQIQPDAQPRPVLRVGGIVGGPPWKALIEGIPGREAGLLLAVGEEWNGFRLVWVRRDSVKVTTPDTPLILGLKQVWR